jgi:hypothetical protein
MLLFSTFKEANVTVKGRKIKNGDKGERRRHSPSTFK